MITPTPAETMAIMRGVRFGVGDRGRCWLEFETKLSTGAAAMQYLEVEAAVELIEAYGVRDVHDLEGKPCQVNVTEPGMIQFVGALVI